MSRLTRNARFLKPALIALVVLDLAVLGAFSVRVQTSTTTTTTPSAYPVPVVAPSPAPHVPPPPAVPVVGLGTGGVTLGSSTSSTSGTSSAPSSAGPGIPATPAAPADPGPPEDSSARVARCVIPIKKPTTSGGLQTLIGFAPAFGPFKAEAFAAASAYQPLLQLLGPVLAKYPAIAPKIEPAMAPFLQAFASLLDTTFSLVEPLYGPYRQGVLEAEGRLATALAPYAEQLATSPLGGCIVEVQAALLEDSAPTSARRAG